MAPCYEYKCPEGHILSETFRISDHPQVLRCEAHDKEAPRVFRKESLPFFTVDNVDRQDWSLTAGDQAKRWKTKADRDRWLTENDMQVVPADHPMNRESVEYLEHQREERRAIEARGERWVDVENERKRVEWEQADSEAADVGITIEKLTPKQAATRLNDPTNKDRIARMGDDSRWFQERASMLPASTPMSAAIPEPGLNMFPDLTDKDLEL